MASGIIGKPFFLSNQQKKETESNSGKNEEKKTWLHKENITDYKWNTLADRILGARKQYNNLQVKTRDKLN